MQRLTRAESQQRTKTLIVQAATRLFLRDGFRSTSLEQVAEEAGFTRGAVYSNFANKTAMGIAVIDALYDRELDALELLLADVTPSTWSGAIASWAQSAIGDPNWARLETEVAAFSSGDPALREATAERFARIREKWSRLITEECRRLDLILPLPADTAVTAALGLGLGLGLQRAADPRISGTVFSDVLVALFTAFGTDAGGVERLKGAPASGPEPLGGELGALRECGELGPHDRGVHLRGEGRP